MSNDDLKIIKFPTAQELDVDNYSDTGIIKLVYEYAFHIRQIYLSSMNVDELDEEEEDDESIKVSYELEREFINICFNELKSDTIPLLRIYFDGIMRGENNEIVPPHDRDWLSLFSHDDPYVSALRIMTSIQSCIIGVITEKLKDKENEEEQKEEQIENSEEETKETT